MYFETKLKELKRIKLENIFLETDETIWSRDQHYTFKPNRGMNLHIPLWGLFLIVAN